jgi:hypothetical protein
MESAPYSQEPRKHWRLRVYVRQRALNQAAKGKSSLFAVTGEQHAVVRRKRVESKGSRPGRDRGRLTPRTLRPSSVKALRYAIPREQRPLAREPWHASTADAAPFGRA